MSIQKVLITGGLGNVGQWVVKETLNRKYEVYVYDIDSQKTRMKYQQMIKEMQFNMIWGDLTDTNHVSKTLQKTKPSYIIHVAAIIAPTAYFIPKIAYNVNVIGTKNLIENAASIYGFKRFVLVSSYSVHGSRNPHKSQGKLTGKSPVNPRDNYGRHKIAAENMLEGSNLDWTIIRLPAVFTVDADFGNSPEFIKFLFFLDPDRNQHAIDARDAGLAISKAIDAKTSKRILDVGGDPNKGWCGKAWDLQSALFKSKGMPDFDISAYRRSDPNVTESWYFEDILDTTESQKLLDYQRISFDEHIQFITKQMGITRYFVKLMSPIIRRKLLQASDFKDIDDVDSRDIWEVIKEKFGMEVDKELLVY